MSSYDGRVAVITGGASGIGYAIAERAGAEGMTVVLVDIDSGSARTTPRARLNAKAWAVHAMAADVLDRAALMMALADRVGDEVGDTWLLVNNAGVFLRRAVSRAAAGAMGLRHHRREPVGRRIRHAGVSARHGGAQQRPRHQHLLGGRHRHRASTRRATTPPSTPSRR